MNFKDEFDDWCCLFESTYGREPTQEECKAFTEEYFKSSQQWMESLKKNKPTNKS